MPTLPFVAQLLGWKDGKPNIADTSSVTSCKIAAELLDALGVTATVSHAGQTAGKMLEDAIHDHFLAALPGTRSGRTVVVSRKTVISDFEQYQHLANPQAPN